MYYKFILDITSIIVHGFVIILSIGVEKNLVLLIPCKFLLFFFDVWGFQDGLPNVFSKL